MKGLFKHFLLCTLLIFHTSFGSAMAAQMQTSHMKMGSPGKSISESAIPKSSLLKNAVASVDMLTDAVEGNPCPHHTKNMTAVSSVDITATQMNHSMTQCSGHDCSNCNCVNVLSSIPTLAVLFDYLEIDRSNTKSFIASTFPESPLDFILRPPIS